MESVRGKMAYNNAIFPYDSKYLYGQYAIATINLKKLVGSEVIVQDIGFTVL